MGENRRMPVLFVGHGSPMNAIEDNTFSRTWRALGESLPRPKVILSVSAHWYTHGTRVNDATEPKTVYDMYGFPKELYEVKYRPAGSPALAHRSAELLPGGATADTSWGIDHGTWSVLVHMFPKADIPVVQLSVNRDAPAEEHYHLGRALAPLRDEDMLIFCSGNVVHNLGRVNWGMEEGGYSWADEFDAYIRDAVTQGRREDAIHYEKNVSAKLAFTMPDHYFPLLYALGASAEDEPVQVFNDARALGALSMTGYLIGE